MDTDVAAHPITNRQNHIEVIEIPLPFHLTCAFHLNCSEFPNSCFFIQLAVLIYIWLMCSLIEDLATWYSSHMDLCVIQIVSSSKQTSIFVSPFSV